MRPFFHIHSLCLLLVGLGWSLFSFSQGATHEPDTIEFELCDKIGEVDDFDPMTVSLLEVHDSSSFDTVPLPQVGDNRYLNVFSENKRDHFESLNRRRVLFGSKKYLYPISIHVDHFSSSPIKVCFMKRRFPYNIFSKEIKYRYSCRCTLDSSYHDHTSVHGFIKPLKK